MKNRNHNLTFLSLIFVFASFHCSVLAQSSDDKNRVASISSSGLNVRWEVAAPYSSATITILAPDGQVIRKEFSGGASLELALTDARGDRLTDGTYTYEIRTAPVLGPSIKDALVAARAKGNEDEVQRDMRKRGILPTQPMVQSGSFSVLNGSIILPGAFEEGGGRGRASNTTEISTPKFTPAKLAKVRQHHLSLLAPFDFVIADDLIVQGSTCSGLDCVNGENFGFDTLRLKENNTRLQFDDTSTSAGFATNNWQIRANSSASGGGSFLAFVDQGATGNSESGTIVFEVDAGAPANSLRVSSTGNIGIGTATPVLDVHANTSDTPAFRLEQNNSGGFTAQTWDIAGNEANFFVRDVTGGSLLPFRIRPGAPTSSLDISSAGNVGIGVQTPIHKLDVAGNMTIGPGFNAATSVPLNGLLVQGSVGIATATPDQALSVSGNASKSVGGGSWLVFSDARLKNLKGRFNSGIKAIMQLQPLRYEYREKNALGLNPVGEQIGFEAQAVQKIIPEAVTRNNQGYLLVNNDPILWTMLNAIKEQQQEIEKLKKEVRQLRATSRKRK
jgi:Chaperone of endosialidase